MKTNEYNYDVVVVGGGLSGCAAAIASAETGSRTLLISLNLDSVAFMQFENIIRAHKEEILSNHGDYMSSGIVKKIQIHTIAKLTNRSNIPDCLKGCLIIDRKRFSLGVKELIEKTDNLDTRQGLVTDVIEKKDNCQIKNSDSLNIKTKYSVICTGTYLDGKISWGSNLIEAGKPGEICSKRLYKNLHEKGIDFKRCKKMAAPKIIKGSINRRSGNIKSLKIDETEILIVSEPDIMGDSKKNRGIYLIPEGIETKENYILGFENKLSEEKQSDWLESIRGMKDSYITRPGYEIGFSCINKNVIGKDLKVQDFKKIYFAGRVTGVDSYEESIMQGIQAGKGAGREAKT